MDKFAVLKELDNIIKDYEDQGNYVIAEELNDLYIKIADSKFDKFIFPALIGTGIAGGIYQETRPKFDPTVLNSTLAVPGVGRKLAKDQNVLSLWKKYLEETGYLNAGTEQYDLDEIEATKKFQEDFKLLPDGSLGPFTLKTAFQNNPNSVHLKNILIYLKNVQNLGVSQQPIKQAPVNAPMRQPVVKEPEVREEAPIKKEINRESPIKVIKKTKKVVKPKSKLNIKSRSKIAWDAPVDLAYEKYFPLRFNLEGGKSNWKYDRGGLTNRGITQAVVGKYYPGKKVMDLNNEQLEFIAKSEFQRTMQAGLPNNTGISMADFDFNSGRRHSNTVMRRTLRDMYGIPIKAMMVKGTAMSRVEPERRILEKIIKQRVNSQQEDEKLAELFNINRNLFYTQECPGMIVSNPGVLSRPDDIAELTGSDIPIEKHDDRFVNINKPGPLKKKFKIRRKMLPGISRMLLKEKSDALKEWKITQK
jgi:hypothetical protein